MTQKVKIKSKKYKKPKKILLFYPRIGLSIQEKGNFEPLALLSLARVLLPGGFRVKIVDHRVERDIAEKLNHFGDDLLCVGISCRSDQIVDGLRFAEYIKNRYPKVPIVWGGWHPTIFCQQTIENQFVDVVVRGQGEVTFLEIVKSLDRGLPLKNIFGLSFKENGRIINNPDRPLTNPNEFPPITYDLLDISPYLLGQKTLYYISSIGCPHRCGYCSIQIMYGRRWFGLEAQRVVREIKNLYTKFNFKNIIIFDDDFFVNKKRAADICNGLIEAKIEINWSTHARVDEIASFNDSLLKVLQQSGCKEIFLGIETASQRMLDIIKKDCKSGDILTAVIKLNKYGIGLTTNFIIGLPDETKKDFQITLETMRKIIKIQPKTQFSLFRFVAMPGTYLYQKLKQRDEIEQPKSLDKWGSMFLGIDSASKPWLSENDKIGRPVKTFYLWLGFIRPEPNRFLYPLFKILRFVARLRFQSNLFFFPIEWWCYKKVHKARKHQTN
ncbi:MAG: B12-binding domain-containing radical SAM protein [Candidatus Hodarchaeales archaeon]|jgi:radical SAM superfamily enzyme YgiQ (UPF0313 family)